MRKDSRPPASILRRLDYSVRRRFVDDFYFRQVPHLPAGCRVLDLGGHKERKRGRFDIRAYVLRVVTLNITPHKGADIQADAAFLPLASGCVDAVICSELLEHVYNPAQVVAEAGRVLREGGRLLATTPFLYQVHGDPHDYGRYTGHYWQRLLRESGFVDIQVEPQGDYHAVMAGFARAYANRLRPPRPFGRPLRWLLAWLVFVPWTGWALRPGRLSSPHSDFAASFTTGYGLVATRGSAASSEVSR